MRGRTHHAPCSEPNRAKISAGFAAKPARKPLRPARAPDARAERRDAILAAALDEFSARGFAATRLDDVAKRAGVAKGTIYLYFADKEALFQELIRTELSPVVGALIEALARRHSDPAIRRSAG